MQKSKYSAVRSICLVPSGSIGRSAQIIFQPLWSIAFILDVYKRQLYDPAGARHRIWHIGRTEAVEAIRTMVQQIPSASDVSSGVLASMVNHAAVSYTHLDVYKRQLIALVCMP